MEAIEPLTVEGFRIDRGFLDSSAVLKKRQPPLCHASPETIGLPKLSLAGETKGQVRPEISGENGADLLRFFPNLDRATKTK